MNGDLSIDALLSDPAGATAEQARMALKLIAPLLPVLMQRATDGDRLLTADDAARIVNKSAIWLLRHGADLPFALRVGDEWRFSENGIQNWIRTRCRK